jgi:hypothetical protein
MLNSVRIVAPLTLALICPLPAAAQVFEVIHPDVVEGGFEFEVLNGVSLGSVEEGEERSAHEIAFAYAPTHFWKTTLAIEIAKPEGESAEFEAFEWENVFLLPIGDGHDHDHDHAHGGGFELEAVGLFLGLEVPNTGGIEAGGFEIGPIAEVALGPVETVTNFLFEVPFADDERTGVAYAVQAQYPVFGDFGVGFEAFGEVEGVFTGDREDEHLIGPAFFAEFDLGNGRVLEPRVAFLFGVTEDAPDAVASVNFELKF